MSTDSQSNLSQDPDIAFRAYVLQGRLCLLGMARTAEGIIPIASYARIEGDIPNGPVILENTENKALQVAGEKAQSAFKDKVQQEVTRIVAEDTCERARYGDQDAMATMLEVKHAAEKGAPLQKYIWAVMQAKEKERGSEFGGHIVRSRNPRSHVLGAIVDLATMDETDPLAYVTGLAAYLPDTDLGMPTVMTLARGPLLFKPRIEQLGMAFGHEAGIFFSGVNGKFPPREAWPRVPPRKARVFFSGVCVDRARKIQAVRDGAWPVDALGNGVAWELGEIKEGVAA